MRPNSPRTRVSLFAVQETLSGYSLSSDGNTAIVGGYFDDMGGSWADGSKGAAWIYAKGFEKLSSKAVAIDPMALILNGKALDIWYEIHHPDEPNVAEIQQVLRSMTPNEQKEILNRAKTIENNAKVQERMLRSITPEERKEALNRVRILENIAKTHERMLRSMTPEEQKAALNRAKTLENYGKAVEEAVATMKK